MMGRIQHFAKALRSSAIRQFIIPALVALAASATPAFAQATFPSEAAAKSHCPTDAVVWLNIPTRIYHEQGMRWYGRTKNGAYVCKAEADRAGDRDTRNGQ